MGSKPNFSDFLSSEDLMTLTEAQDFVGCGRTKLHKLRTRKHDPLPQVIIGGKPYVPRFEAGMWMARQPRKVRRRKL